MTLARPTLLLKTLLVAGVAVAGLAGTSVVALAYPTPTEHHSLECDPSHVRPGGSCTLTFKDKDKHDQPKAGQTICFTVKGVGTVSPPCSVTNSKGVAHATFTATGFTCSKNEDKNRVTVFGQEGSGGDEAGAAKTVIEIKCGDVDRPDHDAKTTSAGHGGKKDTGVAIAVSSLTAGQIMPALGILVTIVALSVAITGRLRLRRLRG